MRFLPNMRGDFSRHPCARHLLQHMAKHMNLKAVLQLSMILILLTYPIWAAAFTKEELELVKSACLAGESFDFHLKADGSISVRNLAGNGELNVGNTTVNVVSVPDQDKRAEFDAIRQWLRIND